MIDRTVYRLQSGPSATEQLGVNITAASLRNTRSIRLIDLDVSYAGATTGNSIQVTVVSNPSAEVLATFQQPGTLATGGALVRNFRDGMRFSLVPGDTSFQVLSAIVVAADGSLGTAVRSHSLSLGYVLD